MKQAISLFNLKKTKTQSQAQNLSQRKPSHSTWLITLVMPATNSHLSESQAAVGNPLCTNLKSKKCHLTGKDYAPKKQGRGGVRRLLSWCCAVISLVVETVCLSGSCWFPGHWAQGIYTEKGSGIVERPASRGRPSLLWCHLLMMGAMSSGGFSLQGDSPSSPPSSSGSLCVYVAAALSNTFWVTILYVSMFLYLSWWCAVTYLAVCSSWSPHPHTLCLCLSVPFRRS